ncbi:hypothetical protein [Solemya velesiana gill symbiont]|uniref:hypothetical protein n=1 Tax=Solemya velesiana gill symbiont TaxID=1918948 RepID=UPI00099796E8|nr:hypothetical protein [Solemya velesiana gill symbiont]
MTADFVDEGILAPEEAVERLSVLDLGRIHRRRLFTNQGQIPLAVAVPASIGVASGRVALDNERAGQAVE